MNNCPRCGLTTKKIGNTILCDCGWNYSSQQDTSQKQVIMGMICCFFLIAGLLFHFFQWGGHALKIVFSNNLEKVEICMELKKYDCVEKQYQSLYKKTGRIDYLENLGELQFKREKFNQAKQTYSLYFSKEGRDYKSAYYYAHSLAKTGDKELAIQYFDSILQSNPNILMVTVMESYLQFLVANNFMEKAEKVLNSLKTKNKGALNIPNQIATWRKKFNI
ncbi:MAG: hypothetical protein GDA46_02960 [Bdellovibrionales bacterium]|nr:hypothetical protein [Bdellovibrionales bacterium]